MNAPHPDVCLLCGGSLVSVLDGLRDHRFGLPGVYAIHRCTHCGAEQTLPRPAREVQRLHGVQDRDDDSRSGGLRAWWERSRMRRLWLRLDGDAAFLLRRGHGRLLHVGAGDGGDMMFYAANGFAVEAWESDARLAARARAHGFTIHGEDLAQVQPAAPYDVIVLSGVLEGAMDPRAVLRDLGRLLAPGGELWISLPNSASLFRELFGRDWIGWHVPFQALHMTPGLLRHLLAESGFLVRHLACVTPTLGLTQSSLVALYSRPGKPTKRLHKPMLLAGWMLVLRLVFFPTLFFLNRGLRGDRLMVRARKAAG